MCNKKLKFVYLDVHKIMEVCVDSITKDESKYRSLPEGAKIAILNDYYL